MRYGNKWGLSVSTPSSISLFHSHTHVKVRGRRVRYDEGEWVEGWMGDGEEVVIGVWSTFSHFHLYLIMLDGRHNL